MFELTGNNLKIIGLAAMTIDHAGLLLFGDNEIMRIIGRLALPLFAYMIAEGCQYTHDKKSYLGKILALGLACQLAYFIADGSIYQGILISFSMAIATIFCIQWAQEEDSPLWRWALPVAAVAADWFICCELGTLLPYPGFAVDYGFWGVMLPVAVYLGRGKWSKLALCGLALCAIAATSTLHGGIQWFGLAALILLAFYNGKRGTWKMKYLFYIYYPAHLVVLYAISSFI